MQRALKKRKNIKAKAHLRHQHTQDFCHTQQINAQMESEQTNLSGVGNVAWTCHPKF